MLRIRQTKLDKVLLIEPPTVHGDFRGARSAPHPANYWKSWDNVQRAVAEVIKCHNGWPGARYLQKHHSALAHGITKHHGGVAGVREKLELPRLRQDPGYWGNLQNVIEEIEKIKKRHGGWPGPRYVYRYYSALAHGIERYHGGFENLRSVTGPSPEKRQPSARFDSTKFSVWSEYLSYWVGLVVTDGHLTAKNEVIVSLKKSDSDVLRQLHAWFGLQNRLRIYPTAGEDAVTLSIHSKFTVGFLQSLGVSAVRKSYNQGLLAIPDAYFSHFLRGVIDGDGSIFPIQHGAIAISLAGTKELLSYVIETVNRLIVLKHPERKISHLTDTFNCHQVRWIAHDALTLRDFIYNQASIYLRRKRNKAYNL